MEQQTETRPRWVRPVTPEPVQSEFPAPLVNGRPERGRRGLVPGLLAAVVVAGALFAADLAPGEQTATGNSSQPIDLISRDVEGSVTFADDTEVESSVDCRSVGASSFSPAVAVGDCAPAPRRPPDLPEVAPPIPPLELGVTLETAWGPMTWHEAELPLAGDERRQTPIVGVGTGFAFVSYQQDRWGGSTALWYSADGLDWTYHQPPEELRKWVYQAAGAGDRVVLAAPGAGASPSIWEWSPEAGWRRLAAEEPAVGRGFVLHSYVESLRTVGDGWVAVGESHLAVDWETLLGPGASPWHGEDLVDVVRSDQGGAQPHPRDCGAPCAFTVVQTLQVESVTNGGLMSVTATDVVTGAEVFHIVTEMPFDEERDVYQGEVWSPMVWYGDAAGSVSARDAPLQPALFAELEERLVAVAQGHGSHPIVMTSSDGISWSEAPTAAPFGAGAQVTDLAEIDGTMVALGLGRVQERLSSKLSVTGLQSAVWTTSDLSEWTFHLVLPGLEAWDVRLQAIESSPLGWVGVDTGPARRTVWLGDGERLTGFRATVPMGSGIVLGDDRILVFGNSERPSNSVLVGVVER